MGWGRGVAVRAEVASLALKCFLADFCFSPMFPVAALPGSAQSSDGASGFSSLSGAPALGGLLVHISSKGGSYSVSGDGFHRIWFKLAPTQ